MSLKINKYSRELYPKINSKPKDKCMKKIISIGIMMSVMTISIAQTQTNISYEKIKNAPVMRWNCPEIEKYQNLLVSMKNDDYKIYANNVKEKFELYANPSAPEDKYLITQAMLNIENPLFHTDNLLKYISSWIEKHKGWKVLEVDKNKGKINSAAEAISIANHASYFVLNKISISPTLNIQLIDDQKLIISFMVDSYQNDEYSGGDNKHKVTYNPKISKVFPFIPKSSYKISYAKAYVYTYIYFWNFISELRDNLNDNFGKDKKLFSLLHYEYSMDSLNAKYGEPTKIIKDVAIEPDINKEIIFYENAKKVICMGKTIDFKDIINCEVVDDPKFIPGYKTTYGAGISFFGFGFGGAETYATPDKTIHNFVVHIKIDNLVTPFMHIATGKNEQKAAEIASCFEYIIRHQQSKYNKKQNTLKKRINSKR